MEVTAPTLTKTTEFDALLAGYHPAADVVTLLAATPLLVLTGPTAAGRNTLIGLLVATGRYHNILSHTTRPPRKNNGILEQDGVEYWFKSEDEVLAGLKAGQYVEAAVIHRQQVSGMHVSEVARVAESGKIGVHEVDIQGMEHFHALKPDTISIFFLPPDFTTWLQRLRARGGITEEEIARRMQSAEHEISSGLALPYAIFVVNHEIHDAAVTVQGIAESGGQFDRAEEQKARGHAQALLDELKAHHASTLEV